jgi:hypothetical protein
MQTVGDSPLERMYTASPCHASWDAMTGDDKARFCVACQKNVYNISMMTRAEAEALISEKEGNLCAIFARRADGKVVTSDCPVGASAPTFIHRPWQALRYFAVAALAIVVAVVNGEAKPITKAKKQAAHAAKTRKPIAHTQLPVPGGIMFAPAPTPTPRPATIIRGNIESKSEPSTPLLKQTPTVKPKVIHVAPNQKQANR